MATLKEIYERNGRKLPFKATDGVTIIKVEAHLSNGHFAFVYEKDKVASVEDVACIYWTLYKEPREPRHAWKWFYKTAQTPYLKETREYYEHREEVISFTGALKAWKNEDSKIDLNKFDEE